MIRLVFGAIAIVVLGSLIGLGAGLLATNVAGAVIAIGEPQQHQKHPNDNDRAEAMRLRRELDDVRRVLAEVRWAVFDRREKGIPHKDVQHLLIKIDRVDSMLLDLQIEQLRRARGRIQ